MIETDKVIRICNPEESKNLDILNRNGNYVYFLTVDDNKTYYYITVDSKNYRLKYENVDPNKLKFTGDAVEIQESDFEFVDE